MKIGKDCLNWQRLPFGYRLHLAIRLISHNMVNEVQFPFRPGQLDKYQTKSNNDLKMTTTIECGNVPFITVFPATGPQQPEKDDIPEERGPYIFLVQQTCESYPRTISKKNMTSYIFW